MIACFQAANPGIALAQSKDPERFKLYLADIGLFTTLMFDSGDKDDANVYAKLLSDKLEADLGYLYLNAVAQIIRATGRELFYHSWTPAGTSHAYEVDFLLTDRTKLIPVEVKSSAVNSHKSLDVVDEGRSLHSLREGGGFLFRLTAHPPCGILQGMAAAAAAAGGGLMAEHSWPAGLPAYPGGRLSPKGYPAGFGLRIPDYEYTYPDRRSRLEFLASLRRYEKAGFSLPLAEGDKAVCKAHLTDAHNDFLFTKTDESLTVAYRGDAGADRAALTNTVFTVTETCAADFARFLQEAQAAGWALAQENEPGSCHSAALMQAGRLVWASLMAGTARITEDRVSALPEPPAAPARPLLPVLLCQYGLAQGKMRPGIRCDCGMLYLLRLGDGSLFVADGGEYEQAGDAVIADVLALMRRLTGTRPGERIPIAAWFCTHPHDDHMDLFGKLLRFHHEELAVERLLFNFASEHFLSYMPEVHSLLTRAAAYCPQAKFYKLHSGQRFLLGGTTFTVLQTHEDGTGEHGDEFIGGYNDTSVVLRADTGRASVLFLGDLGPASERVLLRHWSSEALRSDAVQAAHHLFNDVPDTYRAAAPGLFLVPQVREAMHWSAPRWQALTDSLRPGGEIAFSADGTILWEEQRGGWKRIGTYPAQDADYDGSPV